MQGSGIHNGEELHLKMEFTQSSQNNTNENSTGLGIGAIISKQNAVSREEGDTEENLIADGDSQEGCEDKDSFKISDNASDNAKSVEMLNTFPENIPEIKSVFGDLLEQVWSGKWSTVKPTPFKDTLEIFHPQFRGAHQQDCQEFLALLLDTLHEELRSEEHVVRLREITQQENTTETYNNSARVPNQNRSQNVLKASYDTNKRSHLEEDKLNTYSKGLTEPEDAMPCRVENTENEPTEPKLYIKQSTRNESRGSENPSPKSVDSDSQFSIEDRVPSAIRLMPIANFMKCENSNIISTSSLDIKQDDEDFSNQERKDVVFQTITHPTPNKTVAHDFGEVSSSYIRYNDESVYNMDSEATSRNSPSEMVETSNDSDLGSNSFPTSNLLSKESLYQFRSKTRLREDEVLQDTVDDSNSEGLEILNGGEKQAGSIPSNISKNSLSGETSFMRSISEYYQKENKTLNVNVLADENIEMNNEISFDSDKFSISKLEKMRPQETIDNLNEFAPEEGEENAMDQKIFEQSYETPNLCGKDAANPLSPSKFMMHNYGPPCKQQHSKITNLYNNDKSHFLESGKNTKSCSNIGRSKKLQGLDKTYGKDLLSHATANIDIDEKGIQDLSDVSFDDYDYNEIKRMRLDSSEKEKNVQVAMERKKKEDIRIMATSHTSRQANISSPEISRDRIPDSEVANSSHGCQSAQTNYPLSKNNCDPDLVKETMEANRCWEQHLAENDTIVARTFQGQFKNKVVCSVCQYVSVSFEPFMYLPVPLPNAHIRQVEVTFISGMDDVKPITFLIELTHADSVIDLKKKLLSLLSSGGDTKESEALRKSADSKMQVVEVLDHHVSRTVDDWTSLSHLKDSVGLSSGAFYDIASGNQRRRIYLIEILSLEIDELGSMNHPQGHPSLTDMLIEQHLSKGTPKISHEQKLEEEGTQGIDDMLLSAPSEQTLPWKETSSLSENEVTEEYKCCMICMEDLPTDQLRQHNACDCVMCNPCLERTIEHSHNSQPGNQDDIELEALLAGTEVGQGCFEEKTTSLINAPTTASFPPTSNIRSKLKCPGCMIDADVDLDFVKMDETSGSNTNCCVICMEEYSLNQLFQHKPSTKHKNSLESQDNANRCSAPMCEPCLRRTAEHHRQIKCPGCRQDANPCVEFVALSEIGKSRPKLRSLCLPVVSRLDKMDASDNNRKFITLFGHPGLANVPNQVTGEQLSHLLSHLIPSISLPRNNTSSSVINNVNGGEEYKPEVGFQFVMVNAQGKNCSRCIWNSHCYGCIRLNPKDNTTKVLIQPSDTIAISYSDITEQQMKDANESRQVLCVY